MATLHQNKKKKVKALGMRALQEILKQIDGISDYAASNIIRALKAHNIRESVASLAALDAKFLQNKAKIKEEKALKIINMARDYVNGQTNIFSAGAARALAFKTDSFFKQKHSRLFEELKDESIQVTPTIDLAWMTPDIPNPAIWCEGGDKIAY